MTPEALMKRLTACNLPSDPLAAERLCAYMNLLFEWNTRMDLIAPAPEEEIPDRHFIDSLMLLTRPELCDDVHRLVDVGTGAGFPGMALAIARPDWQVFLIDAQQKRLNFLAEVAEQLNLTNVTLCHARAEDAARDPALRGRFDLAVARAVAPLPVLMEYLLPFARVGGRAVCWKGPSVAEETEAGRKAAYLCGGKLGEPIAVEIPGRDWAHVLIAADKVSPTSKLYPRKAGLPGKKPLGM